MSETLKIKLTIADRVYPLTVAASQEAPLRQSAKKIEGMIKQLEQNYAVRDKQDVLAMCALQFAAQVEQNQNPASAESSDTTKINELIQLIEAHMSTF
ncbi:MAG: cell division protein ZapA [Flavobacteriaceae bacterium]